MSTSRRKKEKKSVEEFTLIHPNAAGIDIGSEYHYVAVPHDRDEKPVQRFRCFTNDLYRLADWLKQCGIDTVAMESTGVYWIPLFEVLEGRGFKVILVNAHYVKNVPGRKTDVQDCQWLQKLHSFGLLRGSFRPDDRILALRGYLRQRERLIEYAGMHIQHMQKALVQMNVQLHKVIRDITGATGLGILRDIVAGNYNPESLIKHRDPRCKESPETFVEALTGNYRPEHLFALKQALELYEEYQNKIRECDMRIEKELAELNRDCSPPPPIDSPESDLRENSQPQAKGGSAVPEKPKPNSKKKPQKNEIRGNIQMQITALAGVSLNNVVGMTPTTVLRILSEIGTDMTRWPNAKAFTNWLTLAPNNKITGGNVFSSKTKRSANRVAKLLRLVAVNVGKTKTALGAFYRRMCARTDKAKAVTATARKLAVVIYAMLRNGTEYVDLGHDYYELRYHERVLKNLNQRAKQFGYRLVEVLENAAPESLLCNATCQ